MKKLTIFALTALLVAAFTLPAAAVEHKFSGMWRTRYFANQDFAGREINAKAANSGWGQGDYDVLDTRTRIGYDAILNDNVKLVTLFEIDATWGSTNGRIAGQGHGDVASDGVNIEVARTYAEFNWMGAMWRFGQQGWSLARGFIAGENASGALFVYPWANHAVAAFWVKLYDNGGIGKDLTDYDMDVYGIAPTFTVMDGFTINPYFVYAYSTSAGDNLGNAWGVTNPVSREGGDLNAYWIGVDLDYKTDMFSVFATGIYLGGEMDGNPALPNFATDPTGEWDFGAYLFNIGGALNIGAGDVHAEFFYSSGDDDPTDNDWEEFDVLGIIDSHPWAEIMGWGLFDMQAPYRCPGDQIENIYAFNLGVNWTFAEKHKVALDGWYASHVEETSVVPGIVNASGTGPNAFDEELGFELDLRYTYELVEGLNLDLVGAYLWAGDGIWKEGTTVNDDGPADQENPWELGAMLSLSF